MCFAAQDKVCEVGGNAGMRVVGVDQLPGFEGAAVVVPGVVFLGRGGCEVEPGAVAAVEVL